MNLNTPGISVFIQEPNLEPNMLALNAIPVLEGNEKTDGFHLMWDPFVNGHLPLTGYSIWRRKKSGNDNRPVCRLINGTTLDSLHNNFFLFLTGSNDAFQKITFRPMHPSYPDWPFPSSTSSDVLVNKPAMFAYDVFFASPVFNVDILTTLLHQTSAFIFAIAYSNQRVVRSKFLVNVTTLAVTFEEAVDKVTIYVPGVAGSIRVCYTDPDYGKAENWQLIRKDLSLPFAGFSPGVGTVQEELDLFKSRLNSDLEPGFGNFENISALVKKVFGFVKQRLLPATSALEFMRSDNGSGSHLTKLNAAPFAMLQSLSVYHDWRMGLGFGYLDQNQLEENVVYDYKITANFHKNSLETIYDFHTVPINTRVGPLFALAGIYFYVNPGTVIAGFPSTAAITSGSFVKGIRVMTRIHIYFPEAVSHFALYCLKDSGATLSIPAEGITLQVTERIEVKLGTPRDNILILGNFIFTGIAYPSLGVGANPLEIIEVAGYSFNHIYKNTDRLPPPAVLKAENNQSQWVPSLKKAPEALGFILSWQHPQSDADSINPDLWPPDCPEPPPPGYLGYYKLEYRDDSLSPQDPWHLYDEKTTDDPTGILLPGDDYSAPSIPVNFGADLLQIFPVNKIAGGTFTTYQRFKHYLENREGQLIAIPGDNYKYRIWSVDLTGRTSISATESNVERLEKRQPPPTPAGLVDSLISPHPDPGYILPDFRTDLRPTHVYARVLQASGTVLTQQERDLLGDRDHITVLTWTWGEEERSLDHYVKEFRVYLRTREHGIINADFTGTAAGIDTDWNISVNLSAPVAVNEFAGHYAILQKNYFRIVSHDAGSAVTFRISPPRTAPGAVPQAGIFKLFRKPAGEESRPASWDKRIAVVPLGDHAVYQYILETGTLVADPVAVLGLQDISYEITALGPNTRCWLGVSAADDQSYVDDQLISPTPFSPRHGNESAIVSAPVQAKFYGRPVFNPPPPLDDVDVLPLDEVNSDRLLFETNPVELMPFLHTDDQLRIERMTGTDLLSLLHVSDSAIQLSDAVNPVILNDWLLNPSDEAELRNVYQSGNKPVPAKFIWAISQKNELHLDGLWKLISPDPFKCSNIVRDYLPNRTDRYIYRGKLVNEIGIPSESAALFPFIWRTPDKTIPPRPLFSSMLMTEAADKVSIQPKIRLDASLAASVKGILLFAGAFPSADDITEEDLNKASLLKIPNRPDLLISQLYRMRVKSLLIEPVFISIEVAGKETEGDKVFFSWNDISLEFPYERTVSVWAASVSNDNVLSPVGPFRKQLTGLTPPVFPVLIVASDSGGLTVSFNTTVIEGLLYRIEKSDAGSLDKFLPVTGWFVASAGNNSSRFSLPVGITRWRLKIRNRNNREFTGNSVQFIP
jgi:hypothetical protein